MITAKLTNNKYANYTRTQLENLIQRFSFVTLAPILFEVHLMKRTVLLFALLLAVKISAAQSLTIVAYDSLVQGNAYTDNDLVSHITIENTTSSPVSVKVRRRIAASNALIDSNAICWFVCYATTVGETPAALTLAAGERNSTDFSGHVYPDLDGVAASGAITYVFFNTNDANDTAAVTIHYEVTPNFSSFAQQAVPFEAYPNPARDVLNLRYQIPAYVGKARFELSDMVGNVVKRVELSPSGFQDQVDLRGLQSGVYFYRLVLDDKAVQTRKLVISSK